MGESRLHKDEMTHQFMYPRVTPVPGSTPGADSGGPAGSAGTHDDTAGGPSSRAHTELRSGPSRGAGRAVPLRSEHVSPQRRDHVEAPATTRRAWTFRLDLSGAQQPVPHSALP